MNTKSNSPSWLLKIISIPLILTIPSFPESQDINPTEKEALVNVIAISKNGIPREGEIISFNSVITKKIFSCTTNRDGKCSLLLPKGDKYDVKYKSIGEQVSYKQIDVPAGESKLTITYTLKYDPPKVYTLKNVFFDTGKATLRKESSGSLNELVEAMKLKPRLIIEIAGHTDNVGSAESNLILSNDRANAVRDYLIRHGIDGKRVMSKGYGETQPVASNDTDNGRQENRRTEVRIISE
jgi:outer membrane protein OmpA-like peptidoglycan-associated protein